MTGVIQNVQGESVKDFELPRERITMSFFKNYTA
jgi:hypothetical protein